MKRFVSLLLVLASLALSLAPLRAAPGEGKGAGKGRGKGAGNGQAFQGIVHRLFCVHERIDRSVGLTRSGYCAVTTSQDPEVAGWLRTHVSQMEARLKGGMGVRRWDPAFAEFAEHYDDLVVEIEETAGGVAVTVSGKTPEAVKVARNHASIVSGFVKKGPARAQATHPAVVSDRE